MATRTIQAFKLRSELVVDASKHHAEYAKAEKEVTQYGKTVSKTAKDIDQAFKGGEAGKKFGAEFGASAVSSITGSIKSLGTTLGSIIGTAIAPGIGTAIGSTIGSGVDAALEKVSGPILEMIKGGIKLNEEIERTTREFTTFTGSEKQAIAYLEDLKKLSIATGNSFSWVIEQSEHIYDLTGNLKLTNTILKAAIDHAQDFGGEAETIAKVGDALGLVAEKGSLASREISKLYKLGIDAKKYLAQATGLQVKEIEKLIKADRLRGDVAARVIAEGIEREKGGFAERIALTTAYGKRARAETLLQVRAQEATQQFTTKGLGDFYEQVGTALSGAKAQEFVKYIDKFTGTLIDWTERGIKAGVSIGGGIAEGLISSKTLEDLGGSFKKLSAWTTKTLGDIFEMKSPSELMAREVGEPLGEGMGVGLVRGLGKFLQGPGGDELVETLKGLLQDPRIQALLNTIAKAEGGAIDVMAGGRHVQSGARHPGEVVPRSQWFTTSKGASSAAGLYQITRTNWRRLAPALGLTNFSDPEQQKLAALALMVGRPGGLAALQSGDVSRMMPLAAKDWTSTPGSTIGGGGQKSRAWWLGQYQSNLAAGGGAPPSRSNPVPVYVVKDIEGGAADILRQAAAGPRGAPSGPGSILGTLNSLADNSRDLTLTLGVEDAAIVNVKAAHEELLTTLDATATAVMDASALPMKATQPLLVAQQSYADNSIAITEQYQNAIKKEMIIARDMVSQIAGAVGQVAGFAPQQQVGKKRSLFSKILGIAAPFLNFIPGVGPILSTIAGAASGFVGGDISGGISSIAGGFSAGGAFRRGGGGGGSSPSTGGHEAPEHRQYGGLAFAGQPYLVGERGPETFIPGESGAISPGNMAGVLEGLRREIARLGSMPAEHVVMKGARGLSRAMDSDAGLADQYGRRLRLA